MVSPALRFQAEELSFRNACPVDDPTGKLDHSVLSWLISRNYMTQD